MNTKKMECAAGLAAPDRMHFRLVLLCPLLAATAAATGPAEFSSGVGRTHLLELYTSEGCSSCPPADRWLAALRDDPRLWRDFVPVAFHVDYWDRLGWPDRFARREYTAREHRYAGNWGSESVYTPCFVLDGREWRGVSGRALPEASAETVGVLAAVFDATGHLRVTFAATDRGPVEVHAVLLGGGIVSGVRAGENEGRTLHHEFVALAEKSAPLRGGVAELSLPAPTVAGVERRALAVWVSRPGELAPLQATGGWLE